jgi:glycosyltransferase involved in cell wall biosynthesis
VRPRIAIVHEWLITFGGSELVLAELLRVFPDAAVLTLIDKMRPQDRAFLGLGDARTSFLQRIPGIERRHRAFLPLFPAAVRSLDTAGFDVIISNSHAVAKGIRKRPGQLHISYCLSPMRYAWDLREQYLRESGLDHGLKGAAARMLLERLRRWDRDNSSAVDEFVTLSHYIADRIRRAYGRDSTVIYPPVDTDFFTPPETSRDDYYITASRFVPYKRIDLIAAAFARLPDRRLIIVGDGPDAAKIRAAAGPNVSLVGHVDRPRLRDLLRGARAFLFAAEEDFGIAPVEAQACGTPVIAFGRGGTTETVIAAPDDSTATGVFYYEQTADAIADAVREFERRTISSAVCRANAERFSQTRFRDDFARFVSAAVARRSGDPSVGPRTDVGAPNAAALSE